MGFNAQDHTSDGKEIIKKTFSPEFRNRIDAMISFNPLSIDVIKTVVDKFLVEVQAQLDDKKVTLELEPDVYEYLARKGYDRTMGARPMQRVVQNELKKPLADMILFGELSGGGVVNIAWDADKDELILSCVDDSVAEVN